MADVLRDGGQHEKILHQIQRLVDAPGVGDERLHEPVGIHTHAGQAVRDRRSGPAARLERGSVGQITKIAGARIARGADRGIQLLETFVESRHAQDTARNLRRAALDTAHAAPVGRENPGIGGEHPLGDAAVFLYAAGRKVAVAFAGIGGQRLDLGQHLAALGGQRPGLVGFAQRGERLGISPLFRVVAASVTAVVADVERLVAVGNRVRQDRAGTRRSGRCSR